MKEALITGQFPLPANDQATEIIQPSEGGLHRPATVVPPQVALVVVLSLRLFLR